MTEVEIKLPVASVAAVRRGLRRAGFTPGPRLFERNLVLDAPDARLRRSGQLLRLRSKGGHWWLTWKDCPEGRHRHKVRREIEIQVLDGGRAAEILARLGFQPALEYQKYRTEFRRRGSRGKALLDETPIGAYLELEGPPSWIDRTAGELGYRPEDYILDSYWSLYLAWCARRGIEPTGMVFKGRAATRGGPSSGGSPGQT